MGDSFLENFWLKLILVLSIFGLSLFFINGILRKWLKVKKKNSFSYNHINDKHKKIDWTIRIIFLVLLFAGFFINITRDPLEQIWFLETHILLFIFIIVSETVRAIMEKRYAENKNDYIFTTIQLVIISIFLLSVIVTDFYGLFG